MPTRDNPVTVYLEDREKEKLERWAEKTGKSISHLCRDAVLEYTDRDRTERVEHEVREVNDKLDRVLSLVGEEHTHTRGSQQSVPETAREIATTIYRNHDIPVHDDDLELVIEDLGGGDERTIKQYKDQLRKRELLFDHPVSPLWTDDKEEWVIWVESALVNPDIHEVTQGYGVSTTEYAQLAEEIEQ